MSELDGSNMLITGGTGSFGKAFVSYALADLNPSRLVIFSRDELKQYEARQLFGDDPRLRWFIGDIRDERRLVRAMHGVDDVVHAAALKQVDTAEYNPFEFIQTNVLGSQNVIEASIDAGVQKVVALSTDKASSPINLYGATKLTRGQALHQRQPLRGQPPDPVRRGALRQRDGQPRVGRSRSSAGWPSEGRRCRSPICGAPGSSSPSSRPCRWSSTPSTSCRAASCSCRGSRR